MNFLSVGDLIFIPVHTLSLLFADAVHTSYEFALSVCPFINYFGRF